jgi:Lar family restriction alleviation protein
MTAPAATATGVRLLPCPFCGSEDVWAAPANEARILFWVKCDACTATGRWEGSIEAACAAWNHRTPIPGDDDAR